MFSFKSGLALLLLSSIICISHPAAAQTSEGSDAIIGFWEADKYILTIEVYKANQKFSGRINSFEDEESSIPSDERMDINNPKPTLRTRKLIGMNVINGLFYDAKDKEWSGGTIYDAGSGKYHSVFLTLKGDVLTVRAYKGLRFLGKTMTFHR